MTTNELAEITGALHEAQKINLANLDEATARRVDGIIRHLRRALYGGQRSATLKVVG